MLARLGLRLGTESHQDLSAEEFLEPEDVLEPRAAHAAYPLRDDRPGYPQPLSQFSLGQFSLGQHIAKPGPRVCIWVAHCYPIIGCGLLTVKRVCKLLRWDG